MKYGALCIVACLLLVSSAEATHRRQQVVVQQRVVQRRQVQRRQVVRRQVVKQQVVQQVVAPVVVQQQYYVPQLQFVAPVVKQVRVQQFVAPVYRQQIQVQQFSSGGGCASMLGY